MGFSSGAKDGGQPVESSIVTLAWYLAEQWDRLREQAADPDKLEPTYSEWHDVAAATLQKLEARGLRVRKVDVDIDDLSRWCRSKFRPLDASARADYAAWRAGEEDRQRS